MISTSATLVVPLRPPTITTTPPEITDAVESRRAFRMSRRSRRSRRSCCRPGSRSRRPCPTGRRPGFPGCRRPRRELRPLGRHARGRERAGRGAEHLGARGARSALAAHHDDRPVGHGRRRAARVRLGQSARERGDRLCRHVIHVGAGQVDLAVGLPPAIRTFCTPPDTKVEATAAVLGSSGSGRP